MRSGRLALTQGFDAYAAIEVVLTLTTEWGRTTLSRTMTFPDNGYRDGMIGSGVVQGTTDSSEALARLLS